MSARTVKGRPAPAATSSVSSQSSVGEAIRGALGTNGDRLFRNGALIRTDDDAEAVHQARVATRHLRSDLRTFGPLLDKPWAAMLRSKLSHAADALGRVRDADVLLERLAASAARLPEPQAADRVLNVLRAERARDRAHLIAMLESTTYEDLAEDLIGAASAPQITVDEHCRASEVLPPLVRRSWRSLSRRVRGLPDQPSEGELHTVRIAAKRARYAAEAVAPVFGAPAQRFAKRLAALQTHLGDVHDATVAAAWLREQPVRNAANALVLGQLIGMQTERAALLVDGWRDLWQRAGAKDLRAWM